MNNQDIQVSIIIVNYNSFSILDNCLKSIYQYAKSTTFEVIIIDNNSTEGDIELITKEYHDIVLIKNKNNEGFGRANNQGLRISKGEFVLFLNSDTIFTTDSLDKIINYEKTLSFDYLLQCKLINLDGTYQNSAYKFPSIWRLISSNLLLEKIFVKFNLFNKYYVSIEKRNKIQNVDAFLGAFIFTRKTTILKLTGFDETIFLYHEDTDLCYRNIKMGGKCIYFPFTSIIHIGGASTKKYKWLIEKNKHIARIKYFKKHHGKFYSVLAYLIETFGNIIRIPIFLFVGAITFNKELVFKSFHLFRLIFIFS